MKGNGIRAALVRMGVCVAVGVLLWALCRGNTVTSPGNTIPDLLFSVGSVMLADGLILLLNRMHAFTSASHSFRVFHRLFRGSQRTSAEEMEELRAKENEKRDGPYMILLFAALFLMILSVLFSIR